MALVFPIINDPDQASDAAPSNTWVLDSSPQLPTRGELPASIRSHNGQLVLLWERRGRPYLSVYRQGSSTWAEIGGQLKNKSDCDYFVGGDIFSWNGDLYALFGEVKLSNATDSNTFNLKGQVARWSEATSAWVYETSSANGLQPSGHGYGFPDNGYGDQGRFFVLGDDLYAIFCERIGSSTSPRQYRYAVNKRDNGSWTRVASTASLSGVDGVHIHSSVAVCSGAVYYWASDSIIKFDGTSLTRVATESTYISSGYVITDESMQCISGTPSLVFTRYQSSTTPNNYSDTNQYLHVASTSNGGTTWTVSQRSRPLAQNATSFYNRASYINDQTSEYAIIQGKGPGVSSGLGIWAYRLDGATWTQLGGGQARSNPLVGIESVNLPFFSQGSLWVPVLEPGPTTSDPMTICLYKTAK